MEALADFNTVEDFWAIYQNLVKPDDATTKCCYHVFHKGIKPIWEDDANKNGGRWHVWLPKGQTNKLWEDLLMHLITNKAEYSDQVCGIEVRTKLRGDSLSVWHKNSEDEEEKEAIKNSFVQALGAENSELNIEYHKFQESIAFERQNKAKKNSGFQRNTAKADTENTNN
jgi:translation initiation factor 4E